MTPTRSYVLALLLLCASCDHPDGEVDCGGGVVVCGAPCPE